MWKSLLWMLLGIAIGIGATTGLFFVTHSEIRDVRASYVPERWSSVGKDWAEFAIWLRHGGRRLVIDGAFSAANDGMSEREIRARFGPPDLVVTGAEEAYSVTRMNGAAGAYFYKIGRFADLPGRLTNDVFAIVFDGAGKVIYRLGIGVSNADRLADIDSDTRSERLIVP